jgi:hypothetical protein
MAGTNADVAIYGGSGLLPDRQSNSQDLWIKIF